MFCCVRSWTNLAVLLLFDDSRTEQISATSCSCLRDVGYIGSTLSSIHRNNTVLGGTPSPPTSFCYELQDV